jgi:hypothetical protein
VAGVSRFLAAAAGRPASSCLNLKRTNQDRVGERSRCAMRQVSLPADTVHYCRDPARPIRRSRPAELDLRSIKQVMQMDVLRCKTPEMVRNEIWGHLLVYNLLRAVMAEAAQREGLQPRGLSFQRARQVVDGFRAELARASDSQADRLREEALAAIAGERVGDRPDRYEPRARKRRERYTRDYKNRANKPVDVWRQQVKSRQVPFIYNQSFVAVASHQPFRKTVIGECSLCADYKPPRNSRERQEKFQEMQRCPQPRKNCWDVWSFCITCWQDP